MLVGFAPGRRMCCAYVSWFNFKGGAQQRKVGALSGERDGLGGEFLQELRATFVRIERGPLQFPLV